ncbi:MAG: fimbria/pilus periplasmic chaperone [Rhizomicrobium sp.]
MRGRCGLCAVAAGVALLASAASAAPAKTLEVAPTTLELTAGQPGLLYVANHSASPVTVQIDVYDWRQAANADRLVLSDSAFVSPPLTTIAPGERQIVRVLATPDARAQETSYRLRVSDLPDRADTSGGVQVLLQFSIPVFVRGAKNDSALTWTATQSGTTLELAAHNTGDRTLKLAGLRVTSGSDAASVAPDRVTYILPDASHVWDIAMPEFAQATRLHIDGKDERGHASIAADIAVAR